MVDNKRVSLSVLRKTQKSKMAAMSFGSHHNFIVIGHKILCNTSFSCKFCMKRSFLVSFYNFDESSPIKFKMATNGTFTSHDIPTIYLKIKCNASFSDENCVTITFFMSFCTFCGIFIIKIQLYKFKMAATSISSKCRFHAIFQKI